MARFVVSLTKKASNPATQLVNLTSFFWFSVDSFKVHCVRF